MIKKVRRKFIIISMAAIIVCTILLVAAINLVNFYQVNQENQEILQSIAGNDGKFPEFGPAEAGMTPGNNKGTTADAGKIPEDPAAGMAGGRKLFAAEAAYETRFFTVRYKGGEVLDVNLRNIASVDREAALSIAKEIRAQGHTSGYFGYYKYYISENTTELTTVVVMDCETKFYGIRSLALTSLFIAMTGIFLMFLIIALCSKRIIQPVIESTEKQKQFITDASHELKTPLTVIATNMDILQMDLGKNEWVEGTKKQVKNMRNMVNQMVSLSRMEEENQERILSSFEISKAVRETAEPFAAMAEFEGKQFTLTVAEHLNLKGDEAAIRQLTTILCDNAVKYTEEAGEIQLSLYQTSNGRKVVLELCNTCPEKIDEKTLARLFDRFYRADAARSKENGKSSYGIGLAIAKAIVEKQGGKISVKQDKENRITFKIVL